MFPFITTTLKINPYSFLFLLVAFIYANLIFILARKRSTLAIFMFLLVLLIMLGNVFTTFLILNAATDAVFRSVSQWYSLGSILSAPLFVTFLLAYAKREKFLQTIQYVAFIFAPSLVMLFLAWNTNLLVDYSFAHALHTIMGNWVAQTSLGGILIPLYQLLYVLIGILVLIRYYANTSDPTEKQTIVFIFFGYYSLTLAGLFIVPLLSSLFHLTFVPMDTILLSLGIVFVAYSLLKYKTLSLEPEKFTSMVFEVMEEIVIIINTSYIIQFINKAGETQFQYPLDTIRNQPLTKLFSSPPFYAQVVDTLLIPLKQKPLARLEDVTFIRPDTKQLMLAITTTKILDNNQDMQGYLLLIADTSNKKTFQLGLEEKNREIQKENATFADLQQQLQKEKALTDEKVYERTKIAEYEHQRLASAINDLSLGFIMTNANKNILLINKAIKNIFYLTYPEGNIALQDIQNHLRGIDLSQQIDLAMQGKKAIRLPNIHADNKSINLFVTPVSMAGLTQAEVTGAVIIIEDTMEAEPVQQAKEEFFTIASHELRTPLSAIRGYLSLIKQFYYDKLPDQQLKQMLTDIDISSMRLLSIINDFLDTSKLEQGKMDVKKEPCDIVPIAQAAIKETESIAIQKKLYLNLQSPPSPIMVIGDKDRLKQIIINLMSNSMKFTNEGGITITIETNDLNFIKVLISDTGRGIAQEGQSLLFHKFQQVNQSSYSRQTGTGLGLYISKLLIEKMGGKVQLEQSEVNKGTTFSLTIPRFNS